MAERKEWSCEHCGYATTDAPRECPHCESSMCLFCDGNIDEGDPLSCPVKAEAADG